MNTKERAIQQKAIQIFKDCASAYVNRHSSSNNNIQHDYKRTENTGLTPASRTFHDNGLSRFNFAGKVVVKGRVGLRPCQCHKETLIQLKCPTYMHLTAQPCI